MTIIVITITKIVIIIMVIENTPNYHRISVYPSLCTLCVLSVLMKAYTFLMKLIGHPVTISDIGVKIDFFRLSVALLYFSCILFKYIFVVIECESDRK